MKSRREQTLAERTNVETLPRRTAHALYALIVAQKALGPQVMPLTASEILVYDGEALNGQQTGAGLRHARRLGLAYFTGRYWTPSFAALDLWSALEDRYLRETGDES